MDLGVLEGQTRGDYFLQGVLLKSTPPQKKVSDLKDLSK